MRWVIEQTPHFEERIDSNYRKCKQCKMEIS